MRHHEFLSEDELFEINMSPSNLTKLVKDIPGARVGLEFEMIVPGAKITGDDDYENDYDYDERARSFRGIYDFFNGGDGNNSRRDVQNMIDALQEHYHQWADEKRWEDWVDNGFEFFKEFAEDEFDPEDAEEEARDEVATEFPDLDRESDEFQNRVDVLVEEKKEAWLREEWENQGRIYDAARESWEDGTDYPDEDDWLEQEGYRYMSDLESFGHDHDVYWPHQTNNSSSETDIEAIADEFSEAVGRPVEHAAGYHQINRANQAAEGFYILETDGSLDPDDPDDEAGLEFVSPPLPVSDMMDEIKKVAAWAKQRGAYTGKNNKTGLHMNVSVPGYKHDNFDYVKLVLLLGDNHILKEFDRVNYTYAKGSFDLLSGKMKSSPEVAKKAMATMKGHFDMAASRALHSGNTDKYTSINVKDNRVEFRGPGGNYLKMFETNPNKLFGPLMRFVVALEAACDPTKYRDEYQKKLYKFLSKSVKDKGDLLSLFTDYAAGKGFAQAAYKSFLKQRKLDRETEKSLTGPGAGVRVAGRKSNPDGSWILFRQHRRENDYNKPFDVEVLYRFNAASKEDVEIVRDQYVNEHQPGFQVLMASDPDKKNGQPGDYKSKEKPDDGSKGSWGVYKKSDGTHMKYRGNYIRFENVTKDEAEAQLRLLFQTAHTSSLIDDYEVRRLFKFELYKKSDGRTVYHDGKAIEFDAGSLADADSKIARYVEDFNLDGQAADYDVRTVLTPPAHTTTSSGEMELYNVRRLSTDTIVSAFRVANHAAAVQKFQDFLMRTGGDNSNFRLERADENGESTREEPRAADGSQQATAPNGVPMWVIYRISDGDVVHRFADHASSHSRTALTWLRDQGFENPQYTFRVRAMSQNEQRDTAVPGSTVDRQQQRAQASQEQTETWEIFNMDTGEVWRTMESGSIEQAEAQMDRLLRAAGLDPDKYDARIARQPARDINLFPEIEPTQQARQEPGRQFTGNWLVKDSAGRELYRFGGVGNNQGDANRVAAEWARRNMMADEFDVVPEMA